MTTLARRAPLRGAGHGGVPARRALIRWSSRLFRREWRQQVLVVALLAVAVAAAIGSITLVYNANPADDGEFGSASRVLDFDGADPRTLAAGLAAARRTFATTEAIGHRSIPVPGGVENVDFRAQDPNGPYGSALLALRGGRYPAAAGEVAVTAGVADLLRLELGATLALDGRRRSVVGIVENPRDLGDEFALVQPASAGAPDHVALLVDAGDAKIDAFFDRSGTGKSALVGSKSPPDDQTAQALATFSVATVFLLLASLVSAAGFAVVAQRRLRQLGMLAATGATARQLRLVLVANGALVGTIAAFAGTVIGLALWVAAAPALESAIGHRVDTLSLPWAVIAMTIVLAVAGATAAAWWPARTISRIPVMLALSGRPPRPRPARHAALAAAILIAIGSACLVLSDRDRRPLIVAGIVMTILGWLVLGPAAIRVFTGLAGRLSIAPRLALRDLVRYQARSGAALAAVTLALGIAASVVIVVAAEHAKTAAAPPNLTDHQIRVYTGPPEIREEPAILTPAQLELRAAVTRQIAADLGGAAVVPLLKPFEPGARPMLAGNTRVRPSVAVARRSDGPGGRRSYSPEMQLYLATPAVLSYLGVDPATIDPATDFLADRRAVTAGLVLPSFKTRRDFTLANMQRIDTGRHLFGSAFGSTKPPVFITPGGLRRRGWSRIAGGWLIEAARPLTSEQIARARERAAKAGLTIEVERSDDTPARAMAIVTAAGALLALGILALTVGLIRSESARDLRTLTATGATGRIRRTLTATTAGALALLGSLLGVAGAYLALLATYHDDLGYLGDVPILDLALALVGVPLAATAAGWLLAGREPPAVARTVIE